MKKLSYNGLNKHIQALVNAVNSLIYEKGEVSNQSISAETSKEITVSYSNTYTTAPMPLVNVQSTSILSYVIKSYSTTGFILLVKNDNTSSVTFKILWEAK